MSAVGIGRIGELGEKANDDACSGCLAIDPFARIAIGCRAAETAVSDESQGARAHSRRARLSITHPWDLQHRGRDRRVTKPAIEASTTSEINAPESARRSIIRTRQR